MKSPSSSRAACSALVLSVACAAQPARQPAQHAASETVTSGGELPLSISDLTLAVGHRGLVSVCADAPRRALFATGGCDGTTRLWGSSQAAEHATLRGHGGPIEAIAFNRDETLLATAGADGFVNVWNLNRAELAGRDALAHGGRQPMANACVRQEGQTAPLGWKLVFDRADRLWLLNLAKASEQWEKPTWSFLGRAENGRFTFSTPEQRLGHSARDGLRQPELEPSERLPCRLDAAERRRYSSPLLPWDRALVSSTGEFVVVAGAVVNDLLPQRVHCFPLNGRGEYGTRPIESGRLEHVIDSTRGPIALLREETPGERETSWRLTALSDDRSWSMTSLAGAQTVAPLDTRGVLFVRPDGALGVLAFDGAASLAAPPGSNATSITATTDGERVAWGDAGGAVLVWDTVRRSPVARLETAAAPAIEVLFAGDGRWLALRRANGVSELWNLRETRAHVLEPRIAWDPALARTSAVRSRWIATAAAFASVDDSLLVRWNGALGYFKLEQTFPVAEPWLSRIPEPSHAALLRSGATLIHDTTAGDVLVSERASGATKVVARSPVGNILSLAPIVDDHAAVVLGANGLALVRVDGTGSLYLDIVVARRDDVTVDYHPLAFSMDDGRYAGSEQALAKLHRRATRSVDASPGISVAAPRQSMAALISDFLKVRTTLKREPAAVPHARAPAQFRARLSL